MYGHRFCKPECECYFHIGYIILLMEWSISICFNLSYTNTDRRNPARRHLLRSRYDTWFRLYCNERDGSYG